MNLIERDNDGRIIHEQRDDGFEEFITYYDNGKIKKMETHYPQGQEEIERFVNTEGRE